MIPSTIFSKFSHLMLRVTASLEPGTGIPNIPLSSIFA